MKNITYIILCSAFVLINFNCTKDFEEINTNPNAPIDVESSFLLRQVIYDFGEEMSYEGFVAGNLLGQYFTMVDFNLFDRHSLSEPQFGGNPWPVIYQNLRDNQIILDKSQINDADKVYEGPARIMKAYFTAMLTDLFGDVPYSEALKAKEGILSPSYDLQSAIYLNEEGILDQLDQAILAIDNYQGNFSLEGDLFYQGDLQSWKRFANSLKLKYLIRISDAEDVSLKISDLFSNRFDLADNSQNASFQFTNSAPNNFRMATARIGDFNLFVLSETMEEILKDLDDPRLSTFFRSPSAFPDTYQGLLNGPNASEISISISEYSLAGTIFREQTAALQANFMTAWETEFLWAEAALKGFIFSNPKAHYDKAVSMAFEYWGTAMPTNYLTEGNAVYDGDFITQIEKIITQKWIANMMNAYEGWIEYRRTGFPDLKTIAASLNNGFLPVRMPYPADEEALNSINFQQASNATNSNSVNHKVWWDVN